MVGLAVVAGGRESGGSWDRSILGNRLPVTLLPRRPLKIPTSWDPDGLPAAYPCGTQGQKVRVNNAQSVTCVHKLSRAICQFSRSEPNSTQTCGLCDTCRHTNRLPDRSGHDVKKKHQLPRSQAKCSGEVHESARRPSYLSVARRIPNTLQRRGCISRQSDKATAHV